MQIQENILLAPYTSFRIGGHAKYFVFAQTEEEIIEAAEHAKTENLPLLIFGGGSNILVNDKGFSGLAVRTETIGMDIAEETNETITLKVASGEVWDDVVRFAVEQGWFGIENLSHIPGFTGAFAVQNVGAYGQEASQVVSLVEAYDIKEKKMVQLDNHSCKFGYRSSIFNTSEKGRYVILGTHLKLQKSGQPNLSYGDLKKYFNDETPTLQEIRSAVTTIRNTKFPFPDQPSRGNAGSFFRGPILTSEQFEIIIAAIIGKFGDEAGQRLLAMKDRLQVPQGFKTPTAFLMDICGLKGMSIGGAKINEPQPAIIINWTGKATSNDVLELFHQAAQTVFDETGVLLHMEPELIGFNPLELTEIFQIGS